MDDEVGDNDTDSELECYMCCVRHVADSPTLCRVCKCCAPCMKTWRRRKHAKVSVAALTGKGDLDTYAHFVRVLATKRQCCLACLDVLVPLSSLDPCFAFPTIKCYSELESRIGADYVLLLDLDETIFFRDWSDPAKTLYLPQSWQHLYAAMQRAKHVLFLTARMDTPKSWLCARTDLAEAGILATRDHVVFTGAAHVKGRYGRIALASRGLCGYPAWFVDDNGDALKSVQSCMPHVTCVEYRGGFDVVAKDVSLTPIVLAPLPGIHAEFL
jgi:hypothetical protein